MVVRFSTYINIYQRVCFTHMCNHIYMVYIYICVYTKCIHIIILYVHTFGEVNERASITLFLTCVYSRLSSLLHLRSVYSRVLVVNVNFLIILLGFAEKFVFIFFSRTDGGYKLNCSKLAIAIEFRLFDLSNKLLVRKKKVSIFVCKKFKWKNHGGLYESDWTLSEWRTVAWTEPQRTEWWIFQ